MRTKLLGICIGTVLALSGCAQASETLEAVDGNVSASDASATHLTEDEFVDAVEEAQRDAGSWNFDYRIETNGEQQRVDGMLELSDDGEQPSAMSVSISSPSSPAVDVAVLDGDAYSSASGKMNAGADDDINGFVMPRVDAAGWASQIIDDSESMARFKGASGTKNIDGTEATKYEVELDGALFAELMGLDLSASNAFKSARALLWLDGDDHIREISIEDQGTDFARTAISFSGWGDDVDVEVP